MSFKITPGTTDDRKPVPDLVEMLEGWLFADKGYIGQAFLESLKKQGIEIFTRVRKNMKEKVFTPLQNFFLNKRGIVETIIDQLKNICQIEHTRHRSPVNAFASIIAGLIAYQFKPRKPSVPKYITGEKQMILR